MQKLKKAIIKIGAIGTAAVLLGAGFGCVTDANHQSEMDTALEEAKVTCGVGTVLSEDGKVCDVVSPAKAIEPEMVEQEVQVFNELWSDDYHFGKEIIAQLGDNKIVKLIDGKVEVDDKEYDVAEYLSFGWQDSELKFVTSSEADKEMEGDSYLHVGEDSIRYEYRFEDALKLESDEDVTIKFLGKDLKIVEFGDDFIEVKKADSDFVGVDGVVGKAKVVNIGRDSVIVEVDGEKEVISLTDNEVTVNGVEVNVESIFYEDDKSERMVELTVGDKIKRTIESGDSYDPDIDEDDAEWVYDIHADDEGLHEVALVYNQRRRDVDEDSDFKALAVGDELVLPNDYLRIKLSGTNEPDYLTVDLYDKEDGIYKLVGDFVYDIEGSEDYDKVYLFEGNFYEDFAHEDLIGTELKLDGTESTLVSSVDLSEEQHLVLNVGDEVHELLSLDPEFVEDETVMTPYGVKFINSEDWVEDDSDKLTIKVPEEQLEGTISVGGEITKIISVPKEPVLVTEELVIEEPEVEDEIIEE